MGVTWVPTGEGMSGRCGDMGGRSGEGRPQCGVPPECPLPECTIHQQTARGVSQRCRRGVAALSQKFFAADLYIMGLEHGLISGPGTFMV